MTVFKNEYSQLMQDYLCGNMPTTDFVSAYLEMFKSETRDLSMKEFEILDAAFGDVDAYTSDPKLIFENPKFYLNESQLKEKIAVALGDLQ
ncbi:MAG: hypothetical protein RL186_1305 [Pseudomonadota bacterium]|jgi:hypothetical protein